MNLAKSNKTITWGIYLKTETVKTCSEDASKQNTYNIIEMDKNPREDRKKKDLYSEQHGMT